MNILHNLIIFDYLECAAIILLFANFKLTTMTTVVNGTNGCTTKRFNKGSFAIVEGIQKIKVDQFVNTKL